MANRKRLKDPPVPQEVLDESAALGQAMEDRFENGEALCMAADVSALANILAERGFMTREEWVRRGNSFKKSMLDAADEHAQAPTDDAQPH